MEVDPQRRQPTLIGVKPDGGGSAGEGATDVEEVTVSCRPRPRTELAKTIAFDSPQAIDLRARDAGRADMERMSSSACSPFRHRHPSGGGPPRPVCSSPRTAGDAADRARTR